MTPEGDGKGKVKKGSCIDEGCMGSGRHMIDFDALRSSPLVGDLVGIEQRARGSGRGTVTRSWQLPKCWATSHTHSLLPSVLAEISVTGFHWLLRGQVVSFPLIVAAKFCQKKQRTEATSEKRRASCTVRCCKQGMACIALTVSPSSIHRRDHKRRSLGSNLVILGATMHKSNG